MKNTSLRSVLCLIAFSSLLISCDQPLQTVDGLTLGSFGAFYTKIESGEGFEQSSRTGEYADIIVDLGNENGKLVFWRGSSYLPYLETDTGERIFVDEIIPRRGDGEGEMPDRANTYSRVAIIENSPEQAIIHWRYLPDFGGENPHSGVVATHFVDEYFKISADGKVNRTIKVGTEKIDDWNDPLNVATQSFTITGKGFTKVVTNEAGRSAAAERINGNQVVAEPVVAPVAWFKFDEAEGDIKQAVCRHGRWRHPRESRHCLWQAS